MKGVGGMDEVKLKPCPFCGGEAIFRTLENDAADSYVSVICSDCGAKTDELFERWAKMERDEDRAKLATNWNARPIEDALLARAEKFEAMVERLIEAGKPFSGMEPGYMPEDNSLSPAQVKWLTLVAEWEHRNDKREEAE